MSYVDWKLCPEPAGPRRVNLQHPILQGLSLRGFWLLNEPGAIAHDAGPHEFSALTTYTNVDAKDTEIDGPFKARGSGGPATVLSFNGTATTSATLANTAATTGPLKPSLPVCVLARVRLKALAVSHTIFNTDAANANTTGYYLQITTGNLVFASFGDNTGTGSTARRSKAGATVLTTDVWYNMAVNIRAATDMDVILDGEDDGGTLSGTGGAMVYTASAAAFGDGAGGAFASNCDIDYLMVFANSVPLDVVRAIQANPFDLLEYFDELAFKAPGGTTFNQALTAAASATATLIKQVGKPLTASSTGTAVLEALKVVLVALTAAASATATLAKQVGKPLAASANGAASLLKNVLKPLTATATGTATLDAIKVVLITLAAAATATASMTRQVGKVLAASGTGAASVTKAITKTLAAAGTGTATLAKSIAKTLVAGASGLASLVADLIAALASRPARYTASDSAVTAWAASDSAVTTYAANDSAVTTWAASDSDAA